MKAMKLLIQVLSGICLTTSPLLALHYMDINSTAAVAALFIATVSAFVLINTSETQAK